MGRWGERVINSLSPYLLRSLSPYLPISPSPYLLIFLTACLFLPLPAWAAALSMEAALGFNGYFQLGAQTPLTVVLENRGRNTSGTVEVMVTSGSEYLRNIHQTTYTMDVELPYNSKKLCAFTILLTTFTHELQLKFRQADQILLAQAINLRPYYTTKNLAVVLDEKTSPDFLTALPPDLWPVNVRPGFLPETSYGYESVKLLVVNIGMLKQLRPSQLQALLQWIKQGGYVVTASGVNYGAFGEESIRQLWPLTIAGHRQFSELAAFADFCGQKLVSAEPFLVLQANLQDAEVVLKEQATPLILQKNLGLGKVLFLTFDLQNPPFSRWPGRQAFWRKILALAPVIENTGIDLNPQNIVTALLANLPIRFPNEKLTFLFLGIYLVLLKVCLKKAAAPRGKIWRSYGALALILTVFSLASYGLFFEPYNQRQLTYNSFALMHVAGPQQIAAGKYLIGLYATKDTAYNVSLGADSPPVLPFVPKDKDAQAFDSYELHAVDSGQQMKGFLAKWAHIFFLFAPIVEFPVVGEAQLDAHGLRLQFENRTPHKLVDCWVYFNNRLFAVGDILPRAEQTQTISQADLKRQEPFTEQQAELLSKASDQGSSLPFLKKVQQALAKEAFLAVHSKYGANQRTACLIGWIPASIVPASFLKAGRPGENVTLLTWEIPVI